MRYDLNVFRNAGRAAALELRGAASGMTGTQIIDREQDAPFFDPQKDYSAWPVGSPVQDDGQVFALLQPHNAAYYSGRPVDPEMRALWSLLHTKDPKKAKPWVNSYGISGMYMLDECYMDKNGVVWRCLDNNVVYPADVLPDKWEMVVF